MPITDWPVTERPREKLLQRGAESLSDAELLAIFLRTGVSGCSAVDLARQMLQQFGGLNPLFAASESAFCAVHGLGQAKYVQLQAVKEMAGRALQEQLSYGEVLTSPAAVRDYLRLLLGARQHEVFWILFLDNQHRVIASESVAQGTLNQASVYPREVLKRTLSHNAAALILAHNHPSGVAEPSPADQQITSVLTQALALIDVRVLDHFIITTNDTLSFAERGML